MNSVIDSTIFHRLEVATANKPGELAELCRDYLTEARATMSQLQAAVATQEKERLRDRAHYLKGSSLMLGARSVVQCCITLEEMGRAGDVSNAKPILESTTKALNAVEAELSKRLGPDALPVQGSAA